MIYFTLQYSPQERRGRGPTLCKSLPNFNPPPSPKKLYTYIGAGRDGADFDFFFV